MGSALIQDSCPCGAELACSGFYAYAVERHDQWLLEHDCCRKAHAESMRQPEGRCGSLAPEVTGASYQPLCALKAGHRGWHSDRESPPCEWNDAAQATPEPPKQSKPSEIQNPAQANADDGTSPAATTTPPEAAAT